MKKEKLLCLGDELASLAVFRALLDDSVLSSLRRYFSALGQENSAGAAISEYSGFVAVLYEANGGNLSLYIKELCDSSENIYVRLLGAGETPSADVCASVGREIRILERVAQLTPDELWEPLGNPGFLPSFSSGGIDLAGIYESRTKNIGKYGYGKYARNRMFYLDNNGQVIPVEHPDGIRLSELVDYEEERRAVVENTLALLAGKPAANILLTGDAGTGKSSTVKAVENEYFSEGLRMIEIRKNQLEKIPALLDTLANNPLKFILFIDDLSFQNDDDSFNGLKAVLEGSVSARSRNVVIYATSNRRHLIKESFSDREGDDVHRNDTMQEILSLSRRFGLHVTFSKPDKQTYLHIVASLASRSGLTIPKEELELLAERFALERGGRSARLAGQFVDSLLAK